MTLLDKPVLTKRDLRFPVDWLRGRYLLMDRRVSKRRIRRELGRLRTRSTQEGEKG